MKIAVASGKGGVGKTTVAVNLAKSYSQNMTLLDCDVEEPNCHLFLTGNLTAQKDFCVPVPQIDETLCHACGECSRFCAYNAITSTPPIIFPEMCHACGGCVQICPHHALTEKNRKIGVIEQRQIDNLNLISGILNIGEIMSPALIKAVKAQNDDHHGLTIIDAPPGTSCPVTASLLDADLVLLVTEPTPFGLHDLTLIIALLEKIKIPFQVIVNRMITGYNIIHNFCREKNLKILAEIPEDLKIAQNYAQGKILINEMPEYQNLFKKTLATILKTGV